MTQEIQSKLILAGNINIPSFINCILAATEQLRNDNKEHKDLIFNQIHVFHTENSLNKLMSEKEWMLKLQREPYLIPSTRLVHHVTDVEEEGGFEDLVFQLKDVINPLDKIEYYIDLSGGRASMKSILTVFAFVLNIEHIYTLEVDFSEDFSERKNQVTFFLDEIEAKKIPWRYKRFPQIGRFDNFGKLNLTEIIRYPRLIDELLEDMAGKASFNPINSQRIKDALISGIGLRLTGEAEYRKNNHFNSVFSFSTAVEQMALVSLKSVFDDYNFNKKEFLSIRLEKLNNVTRQNSKYFINKEILDHLTNLINAIRNDAVHPSIGNSKNSFVAQIQSNISQHLVLNYIKYVSKSISSFHDGNGSLLTINEISLEDNEGTVYYFGFDGDGTGDFIEKSFTDNLHSEDEVKNRSLLVKDAIKQISNLIRKKTKNKDAVIFGEGDNILFKAKLDKQLLEKIQEKFTETTGLQSSIGYGQGLHEASIALKLAKAKSGQKIMGIRIEEQGQADSSSNGL